jgi:hypothetical protein
LKQPSTPAVVRELVPALVPAMMLVLLPALLAAAQPVSVFGPGLAQAQRQVQVVMRRPRPSNPDGPSQTA